MYQLSGRTYTFRLDTMSITVTDANLWDAIPVMAKHQAMYGGDWQELEVGRVVSALYGIPNFHTWRNHFDTMLRNFKLKNLGTPQIAKLFIENYIAAVNHITQYMLDETGVAL